MKPSLPKEIIKPSIDKLILNYNQSYHHFLWKNLKLNTPLMGYRFYPLPKKILSFELKNT